MLVRVSVCLRVCESDCVFFLAFVCLCLCATRLLICVFVCVPFVCVCLRVCMSACVCFSV